MSLREGMGDIQNRCIVNHGLIIIAHRLRLGAKPCADGPSGSYGLVGRQGEAASGRMAGRIRTAIAQPRAGARSRSVNGPLDRRNGTPYADHHRRGTTSSLAARSDSDLPRASGLRTRRRPVALSRWPRRANWPSLTWCATRTEAAYAQSDLFERRRGLMDDWLRCLNGRRDHGRAAPRTG